MNKNNTTYIIYSLSRCADTMNQIFLHKCRLYLLLVHTLAAGLPTTYVTAGSNHCHDFFKSRRINEFYHKL